MSSNAALQFWGKTYKGSAAFGRSDALGSKPLLHHLLDVAAAARVYLRLQPSRLAREAKLVSMAEGEYVALIAFFAGLHDLGKFALNFQAKVEALWPAHLGEYPVEPPFGPPHWRATGLILELPPLRDALAALFPNLAGGEGALLAAIAGHHGRPPPADDDDDAAARALRKGKWLSRDCLAAASFAFDALVRLTGVAATSALDEDNAPLFSWRLAGVITLADWVGSDAEFFGPSRAQTPLEGYWLAACATAKRALYAKGLAPLQAAAAPSLARLSPQAAAAPRPMQRFAAEVEIGGGAKLFLIEDTTGAGKTEAALMLAARLMEAGAGEGVYFALPTMATANAMHARLESHGAKLFADAQARAPSILLSHGKARVAAELARLEAKTDDGDEESTAASCNAWIADDRRRAFFADIGAGTIDQAFLAVLPKKHLTLRQYALASRILIVDEAHCFDAYMKEELGALVRLHAMNGGSTIVLSATLAQSIRRDLIAGFCFGLGFDKGQVEQTVAQAKSDAYPLLTEVGRAGIVEHTVAFDARLARKVIVERLEDRAGAARAACQAADNGAAVLVICNAVDEAIAFYESLCAQRPPETTHLFHARFAQADRIDRENQVLARFGREASPADRSRHILVATQVVEQSLDLDFDLVISDLAPIDLLIQRAGRLWRHMEARPKASRVLDEPRLLVVSADPDSASNGDWLVDALGKAAHVYQNAGVLWRSARALARGAIRTPEDLRPMIEAVYGEDGEAVPEPLLAAQARGEGKERAARALGAFNVVDLTAGYNALSANLSGDEDIGTRLGEPTITLRLARRNAEALVPWRQSGGALALDWALSEIRVRKAFWGETGAPAEDAHLHQTAKASWQEWEDAIQLVEVGADGALRRIGDPFGYSPATGLFRGSRL